jgi:uncharacterized protein (DUF2062 family)
MKEMEKGRIKGYFSRRYREFVERFRALQGDPHYIAMGMAVGIFVAITPTIPFHTVLAIAMAFLLGGSKPAAIIGVWFSNPVTIPFLYLACYKAGVLLLGRSASDVNLVLSLLDTLEGPMPFGEKCRFLLEFARGKLDIVYAMMAGGVVIGIPPSIAAYFITRKIVVRMRRGMA